jgi:plasmid stabilization system protein ParE
MPKKRLDYVITWSEESSTQLFKIEEVLFVKYGEYAIEWLNRVILRFVGTLQITPRAFPRSVSKPTFRKGLIHPHLSALYRIRGNRIEIVTIILNRRFRQEDFKGN